MLDLLTSLWILANPRNSSESNDFHFSVPTNRHASRQLEMPRNSGRALMCGSFLYSLCRQLSHRREDFLPQGFSNTLCSVRVRLWTNLFIATFKLPSETLQAPSSTAWYSALQLIKRQRGDHTALSSWHRCLIEPNVGEV